MEEYVIDPANCIDAANLDSVGVLNSWHMYNFEYTHIHIGSSAYIFIIMYHRCTREMPSYVACLEVVCACVE